MKTTLCLLATLIFSGCAQHIAKLDYQQAKAYENQYQEELKNLSLPKENFKMVQVKNKKEKCLILTSKDTKDESYEIYWDGLCKNGYAHGLGREIEKTLFTHMEQIGIYKNGKVDGYYYRSDINNNLKILAYNNNKDTYFIDELIAKNNDSLNIVRRAGKFNKYNALYTTYSPFSYNIQYTQKFQNYSLEIFDFSKNNLDTRMGMIFTIGSDNIKNGFEVTSMKSGEYIANEFQNNKLIRNVQLPQEYFSEKSKLIEDIEQIAKLAMEHSVKANIIKEKYKKKICKESIKINFIDNNEYKEICNEDAENKKLSKEIEIQIAKIKQYEQEILKQYNEERLIKAKELEAQAAMERVREQRRYNQQQYWQNIMLNNQLQQLNNNMMYDRFTPKTHHIYIY
ncbi:hypothetical protein EJ753_04955 [Campylobacter lari]|nr:hypothetical protein [Campylobacter lari]